MESDDTMQYSLAYFSIWEQRLCRRIATAQVLSRYLFAPHLQTGRCESELYLILQHI